MVVEQHLVEQEHALRGRDDFGDIVEITLHDHNARHAAGHLDISAAMVMRVVPIRAARMILRDRDIDIVALPRLH